MVVIKVDGNFYFARFFLVVCLCHGNFDPLLFFSLCYVFICGFLICFCFYITTYLSGFWPSQLLSLPR